MPGLAATISLRLVWRLLESQPRGQKITNKLSHAPHHEIYMSPAALIYPRSFLGDRCHELMAGVTRGRPFRSRSDPGSTNSVQKFGDTETSARAMCSVRGELSSAPGRLVTHAAAGSSSPRRVPARLSTLLLEHWRQKVSLQGFTDVQSWSAPIWTIISIYVRRS